MNLEDHLGDIIRKGRKAANVSAETAAQAAGLTLAELSVLEESGKGQANIPALAKAIGLHAGKLEGIASGWVPSGKNLGAWIELRQFQTEKEGMVVNSFLVWDEVS